MALFKIFNNIDSQNTTLPSTYTKGYMYYDAKESIFYIDIAGEGGTTGARKKINAWGAEKTLNDSLDQQIDTTYIKGISISNNQLSYITGDGVSHQSTDIVGTNGITISNDDEDELDIGLNLSEAINELEKEESNLSRNDYIISENGNEASGNIATFETNSEEPIKKITVDIEPVQDLHGYDHPWPAGGGKNLWNGPADVTKDDTTTYVIANVNISAGTYTLSCLAKNNSASGSLRVSFRTPTAPTAVQIPANYTNRASVNITLDEACTQVYFYGMTDTSTKHAATFNDIQLELGSTATAYEPYSNICQISGWTGCNATRTGKNLVFKTLSANIQSNGVVKKDADYRLAVAPVKAGAEYTINILSAYRICAFFYQEPVFGSTSYNGARVVDQLKTFTAPIDGYIAFRLEASDPEPQLELGSTATAYEPYQSNTYDITFPTEAGTVYGGMLTINADGSADLIDNMQTVILNGSSNPFGNSGYDGTVGTSRYFVIPNTGINSPSNVNLALSKCNKASATKISIWALPDSNIWKFTINSSYQLHVCFDNASVGITTGMDTATRTAAIKSWLANNPMTFVVQKQSSDWDTYHFNNVGQITTLLGINNIWADCGDINVVYTDNNSIYKRKKIGSIFSTLNSKDITDALGYTPYNATINPNGYISNVAWSGITDKPNSFASASDNILKGSYSGTVITYAPYTSQQAKLSFDTSNNDPTRTDRLNLNGILYATKFNGPLIGPLRYYYSSASTTPVISVTSNNQDATILWFGHDTSIGTPSGNYYKFLYKGTEGSPNNYFQLIAGKNSSSEVVAMQINEEGNVVLKSLSIGGNISATGNLTITGNTNLNNETYADSLTAGSLLVTGNSNFTQIPTAPTPADDSNDTSIATTAFVKNAFIANDAMIYKGTLNGGNSLANTTYTPAAQAGWTYKVATAGYINGIEVEIGDTLICLNDNTVAATSANINDIKLKWNILQTNIDGTVFGPSESASGIAMFTGTTGKAIKDSGKTITTTAPAANSADTTIPTSKAVWTTINNYVKKSGDTMTGNLTANGTATLGTSANPWHQLVLGGSVVNIMTSASTNPRITFQEGTGTQPVHLVYTDLNNYRAPAGLKVVGGESANPAWFEVEGNIYAAAFKGTADKATDFGRGTHTAAVTANEFGLTVGYATIVGNVSNTTMPHINNANAEMIIKAHPTSGTNYYEARFGFSSNEKLYYMPVNDTNWKQIADTDYVENSRIEVVRLI